MKRPTLEDIAQIAGVSVPTVSLVLTGKGRISDGVRTKVMKAAGDLGYLKSRYKIKDDQPSNSNIGMLYRFDPNWSHVYTFLEPMVIMLDKLMMESGHYLSLIPLTHKMSTEVLMERILRHNLKAVLSVHFADKELFIQLEDLGIPVVIINDLEYQEHFYCAGVDNLQGTFEATKYLVNLGHEHIAYVDYPREDLPIIAKRRRLGYRAALEEFGIEVDNNYFIEVDVNDVDMLVHSITELLALKPRPTALIGHDDYLMIAVMHAAELLGIKIPEDISVISHGDTQDFSNSFTPQITTMRINTAQLGKLAAEMLINRLKNQPEDVHVVTLKEQLVDRGSCRSIKAGG